MASQHAASLAEDRGASSAVAHTCPAVAQAPPNLSDFAGENPVWPHVAGAEPARSLLRSIRSAARSWCGLRSATRFRMGSHWRCLSGQALRPLLPKAPYPGNAEDEQRLEGCGVDGPFCVMGSEDSGGWRTEIVGAWRGCQRRHGVLLRRSYGVIHVILESPAWPGEETSSW